jgi:hypothetical protein
VDDTRQLERTVGSHRVNAPAADPVALRLPPHSTEAEQSLLAGLMLDASLLAQVSDLVAVADFFSQTHQQIFLAITSLIAEGASTDIVSVYERLEHAGQATAVGLPYLNALSQSVPSAAAMPRYAEIIAERAALRALIATTDELAARAFRNESSAEIVDDAKLVLAKLAEGRKAGAGRLPLYTLGELREHSHASRWVIKHVLPAESIGMLFGGSGTFKSFVAIDMAMHVAHGLPWLGRRTKQGSILYLAAEGGSGLWPRICAWHRARRLPWKDVPVTVVPVAVDLKSDATRVVEAVQTKGLEKPALVVVDTFSQTYVGEENSSNEVAAYFRAVGNCFRERWGCAVLIIHHTGHIATERPRGSSAMHANLDFMFGVFRDEKEMLATLTCGKQKDGEAFQDAVFSLSKVELGTDEDGDMVKSLVARHLTSAEDVQDAMQAEGKAGRAGNNHLLMGLLQNGSLESELRTAFMKECSGDSPEARRQAYSRAKRWATQAGLMEVSGGIVITLQSRAPP